MSKPFQVIGVGNAIVDVLAYATDEFLRKNKVEKGIMTLIDTGRAQELYDQMGPAREISGGSAANTIAGIAALGGRTAYVGKVKDDQLGAIFAHDLRAQGAVYDTPMAPGSADKETGRCMVLVTPDGERSMSTYLGWSEFLSIEDIDPVQMAETDWLYLEGYRFDGPDSHAAFAKAIAATHSGGGKVSITLSDPFCVDRHRDAFLKMIRADVELLFANEHELKSLYQTNVLEVALDKGRADVETLVCTRGADGAILARGATLIDVPAVPTKVMDVTGAGDLMAAGVLYGLSNGYALEVAGRMGCLAASESISHIGARPEADLKALFAAEGLI